jgi:hypothetical protein
VTKLKNKLAAIALIILLSVSVFAGGAKTHEEGTKQVVVPLEGGGFVSLSTEILPAGSTQLSFSSLEVESNVIHRVLVDEGGSFFFGYDLVIEPLAASKQFRVTVRPLSPDFEQRLRARKSFQTRNIHPNFNASNFPSAPQVIRDGDAFALDVLVNPRTNVRISDVLKVSFEESSLRDVARTEGSEPRDFTLADVALKMSNYKLYVDGELIAGAKPTGACAGPVIWFYAPGRGRFIFSLIPQAGYDFKRTATVEHNKITFTHEGERFEWVSSSAVVGIGGNWNLYVLHDPSYVPDPFLMGVRGANTNKSGSSSSRWDDIETTYPNVRRPKNGSATGFGGKDRAQKDESDTPSTGNARIIIGAANHVELLLPKN